MRTSARDREQAPCRRHRATSSTSRTLGIPGARDVGYGRLAMTGRLNFYDRASAWGVIAGDDGHLYSVVAQQLTSPELREGDRVHFEPVTTRGAPIAGRVRRLAASAGPSDPRRRL
jgi:cold shock CspA family protein